MEKKIRSLKPYSLQDGGGYVVLTFESVDKMLWYDHSNEASSESPLHGTVCFSTFTEQNLVFLSFLTLLGVKESILPLVLTIDHKNLPALYYFPVLGVHLSLFSQPKLLQSFESTVSQAPHLLTPLSQC